MPTYQTLDTYSILLQNYSLFFSSIYIYSATAALALGDGTPAYSDHKEECGLLGVMIKGVNKNEVLVDVASETECAARCALGCLHECQSFKYDADAKTCHFINWAEADLAKSYSPTGITDPTKLQTSNSKYIKKKFGKSKNFENLETLKILL